MKRETIALHNGNEIDPYTGAASIPIYQASTFHQFSLDHPNKFDYTRSGNPTREALENAIAKLEGGCRGFAFASGMAAISTTFLLFSRDDHLIVSKDVYGGTYRLLTQVLVRLGIEATFVDTTDIQAVEEAIRPNTKGIYIETPSNPLLKVSNLALLAKLAKAHNLLTIADNTFLTPYYQQPLHLGIDVVVHSATKFIGGHSDVVAGLVVAKDEDIAEKISFLQNSFGAILGVQDSWLILRGLKTLPVRMKNSSKNAEVLACWLEQHPAVQRVYYTGLPSHEGHEIQSQQASGHGAVLSFDVGSEERAKQILNNVRLPLVAVSLGAVESILSYPAKMSHASIPREVRLQYGISDGLLRFSVGLEDVDDLIADLEQALQIKQPLLVSSHGRR